MRILAICLILFCSSTVFAFGGRRQVQNSYYYPTQYYYYPQSYTEKYVIPVRDTKFAEVRGLQILEDKDKAKYIIVNGKLYALENGNLPTDKIVEDIKEYKNQNKIIIEKEIKY